MANWTIQDIETEIGRYTQNFGATEHTGTALRGLVGRCLSEFAAKTECFHADTATLTTSSGAWDLRTLLFTVDSVQVRAMRVKDIRTTTVLLTKMDVAEGQRYLGLFRSATTGTPSEWVQATEHEIVLVPGPSASTAFTCSIAYYPLAVTSASGNTVAVNLPEGSDRAFILYAAAELMRTSSGAEAMQKQAEYSAEALRLMQEVRERYAYHPVNLGYAFEVPNVSLVGRGR